jgi:hypothetical protein
MESKLKFPTICKGCKRQINNEYELWDDKNGLCDGCSMKNAKINKLGKSYIN